MLTVEDLVGALELELVAGQRGAGAPIRWVHVSELVDPTPWLSGGELLLSTGMQLLDAEAQRAYVHRLVEHHLAGLGFGVGFAHEELPAALVEEAAALEFPLFAVPYEMPFIAITERAFGNLLSEQLDVLQRAVAIQRRMERLVIDERSLAEVVRGLANAIGATVIVLDGSGRTLAAHAFRRELDPGILTRLREEVVARARTASQRGFVPALSELTGRAIALPVPSGSQSASSSWLIAVPESDSVAEFERFVAHHAVMVVALAQMRERVVAETERRLAGDVLGLVLGGRIDGEEIAIRLAPFQIGGEAAVLLLAVEEPEALEPELDRILGELGVKALVATVPTARRRLLCAVIAGGGDPLELAASAREALSSSADGVRAAVSHSAPVRALRRSFHEARCALEIGALANGSAAAVASADDLGAYRLLLSLQDDDGLRQYCDDVLTPIERARTGNSEELLRSLEAFLEHNGSWEAAARALFCHRHTLRYRISRIEELTGRRLDRVENRIEFWLALRGRELLGDTGTRHAA
ncbi:MAG TPA: PucR family transcriptional regulator [Solirubrobacteraceae bacterium]|nr:PucR family transcriptional regulator [Solirubrobacteraceae bacterium]